jgi:hypothetical protein
LGVGLAEIILSEIDRNAGDYLQTVFIRPHSHTGSDEIRRREKSSIHRDRIEPPFGQDTIRVQAGERGRRFSLILPTILVAKCLSSKARKGR